MKDQSITKGQGFVLQTGKNCSYGLFGTIIGYLFVMSVLGTCVMCYTDEHIYYIKDYASVIIVGIVIVTAMITIVYDKVAALKKHILGIGTLLWVLVLVLMIFFLNLRPQHDPGSVYDAAGALIAGNYQMWQPGEYMYTFPFQNGLVLLEVPFWLLFGQKAYLGIQVYNVCMWLLAIVGLGYLAKEFFGEQVAKITYIILLLFIPMWTYTTYCYGTIPGLTLGIMGMCFEHKYENNGKTRDILLCALCMFFSVMYKSNYEIFVIAIVIMFILHGIREKSWKPIVGGIIVIAAVVTEIKLIPVIMHWITGADTGNGIPMIAWVAMGIKESNIAPGWYNRLTVLFYEESNYDVVKTTQLSWESIKETMKLFHDNVYYSISFFNRKIVSIWNSPELECFTTISKMNINGTLPYYAKDILYNGGIINTVLFFCLDFFQSLLYGFVFLHVWMQKKEWNLKNTVLLITFLGGFIFHIFWEAKCQYSIPYYVLLFPYAAKGVADVVEILKKIVVDFREIRKNRKEAGKILYKNVLVRTCGCLLIIVLGLSAIHTKTTDAAFNIYPDTAEWIYFMQNSTQWKNADFYFGDSYYNKQL